MYGIRVKTSNSGDGATFSLCFLDIENIEESMESLYEKVSEKYYKEELYGHEV